MREAANLAMAIETLAQKRVNLETAVERLPKDTPIPPDQLEAVRNYLTYEGESAILAGRLKESLLAEGTVQEPHTSDPLVSVIIPCHNYGRYLRECVESVLMQTFAAWEVIIINDGSTDDTNEVAAQVIKDYPKHALRYYEQQCQGIVQPRNRGVSLAKGAFILPLDADDLIAPKFLELTVAKLTEKPHLGYVSTKALFFGSSNKIWPREAFNPLALLFTNQQGNTTLYRKSMWVDVGGYEPTMIHGYMDWEFWIDCTKMGWTGEQLEVPYYLYRRKVDSVVMKAKKRDQAIKTQIMKLHPEIYDLSQRRKAGGEMNTPNWIPPVFLRNPLPIRQRPVRSATTLNDKEQHELL